MNLPDAANWAQIIGLILAVFAARWAYAKLTAAIATAETQAVLALDQAFAGFEELVRS